MSPAPVAADSPPGHPCQGPPDTRVTPRTTRGTQRESPPPQACHTGSGATTSMARGGGNFSDLEYPKGLVNTERERARYHLKDLPIDLAQQVLDELSAHMVASSIRVSPLAYLRGLVRRARAGEFVPEAGLQVEENRRRRAHAEAAMRRAEATGRDFVAAHPPVVESPLVKKVAAIQKLSRRVKRKSG